MGKLKVPSSVSSITVSGSSLTPDASGRISTTSDADIAALLKVKPKVVYSKSNGDVVIQLPLAISSITMSGSTYTPDASGQITVPAAAATAYLQEAKYAHF